MEEEINKIKKAGNWISAIFLGNTRELIARINERTNFIANDLKDIKPKIDDIFPKVDILWKDKIAPSHSPRQLNDRGKSILEKSGIKEIVDTKKGKLLQIVKEKGATNPYDAERIIFSIMADLPAHCPDIMDRLKTGAFNSGESIETILFAGGIYLRNIIFPDLGFEIEELDKPKT